MWLLFFSLALTQVGSVALAEDREEPRQETFSTEEIESRDYPSFKDPNAPPVEQGGCTTQEWGAAYIHCGTNHPGCYVVSCTPIFPNYVSYGYTCA